MKRTSVSPYVPVIIIALGAAAVMAGVVMAALRERQRQRRGLSDDPLADTAEIDVTSVEIAAANDLIEEPSEMMEEIDAVLDDRGSGPAEVPIEAVRGGIAIQVAEMVPSCRP